MTKKKKKWGLSLQITSLHAILSQQNRIFVENIRFLILTIDFKNKAVSIRIIIASIQRLVDIQFSWTPLQNEMEQSDMSNPQKSVNLGDNKNLDDWIFS